jgi:hypothetical protein
MKDKSVREIWIHLPESTEYFVSNTGKVKRNNRILKPLDNGTGYFQVSISGKRELIQRLVLTAYLGTFESSLESDHKDRNRKNNYLSNLQKVEHHINCQNRGKRK